MNKNTYFTLGKPSIFLIVFFLLAQSGFAQNQLGIYGYFSARGEKIFSVPVYEDGEIESENEDWEWQYPYFNIMMQYYPAEKFKTFLNLNGGGKHELKNIEVRNVWGEYEASQLLKIRVGKSYRKFDLFNEILDAVPTYYGIEPPQFLNQDHTILLLYPRTTPFMLYGSLSQESGYFSYSLAADKGSDESYEKAFPLSVDLNYNFFTAFGSIKLGVSGFSTFGDVSIEDDEMEEAEIEDFENGTLPWMEKDNFKVYGGYFETRIENFTLQTGLWLSDHESERNLESLEELLLAKDNQSHINRFLVDSDGEIEETNLIEEVEYSINTWYIRLGYSFYTGIGEIAPYLQWDYYKNPELVALFTIDSEHNGVPDDGKFQLITAGLVYRPIPQTAIKFDVSNHMYRFYGEDVSYPELKLDFSFIFGEL